MRIILILCLMIVPAMGETVARFYDEHGNPRGQLDQQGSKTYIRDQNNNSLGYYQKDGDKLRRYDKNGNPRGYSR